MKILFSISFILIAFGAIAQNSSKGLAVQDTTCMKLKPAVKMEGGNESEIMTAMNSCKETLDIQIYKQNKNGHWFSSRYDAIEPGDYIRTGISLTGKYVVYKRISDSKETFPTLEEVRKKHSGLVGKE